MIHAKENVINIWTDGSAYSNPRRGGCAAHFVVYDMSGKSEYTYDYFPPNAYRGATINEMELQACIDALNEIIDGRIPYSFDLDIDFTHLRSVSIYSDSQYVTNNISRAIYTWPRYKWLNRFGKPIDNAQLWEELVKTIKKTPYPVKITWGKGHSSTNPRNKIVDKLAKEAANQVSKKTLSYSNVGRKKSRQFTQRGSVILLGQQLTIYIVETKYFSTQKITRIRYQVVSRGSPYKNFLDIAYTDLPLRARHTYSVRFNNDVKNPRIIKLFKEVM